MDSHRSGGAMTDIVSLRGVRKLYGAMVAVETLNLDIARGSFFTLLGPSGSGKTTILRLIAGFEYPDAGGVFLSGEDVSGLPPNKRDVNTVFQDYALFPHMSLLDNVAYGLMARSVKREEAHRRARLALEQMRLGGLGARKPSQLSGGQRQRVALARAIVNRPAVLLLDEPLGALDLKLRHQMQVELKALQAETGITFVYVTHDQEEALTMSDRVAVFRDGKIEQEGTPFEIYEQPASAFVADFVGASTLLRRRGQLIMLRPEKVRLFATEAAVPDGNWFEEATVIAAQYLGMATRITVELRDGTHLLATWQNAHADDALGASGIGMSVLASWRPADAYVLPESI
jgi:putative spermidine/putrescine transport system ATP-binding protein